MKEQNIISVQHKFQHIIRMIKLKNETGNLSSRTRKRKFKVLDPEKLDEYMKNPENTYVKQQKILAMERGQ